MQLPVFSGIGVLQLMVSHGSVNVYRQQMYCLAIQVKHRQISKLHFFSYSYPLEHFALTERSYTGVLRY